MYGHYGSRYRSCSLREYMPINETDQRIYPLWKSTRECPLLETYQPHTILFSNKHKPVKAKPRTTILEDTNLVSNIHGLRISGETHERLLEAESSDHGVDLLGLHSVQLVDGVADLLLVGTEVDEEGKDVLGL